MTPGVVVVFEVVDANPRSIHMDRIVKVSEYQMVLSIRRYVLVESSSVGLTVLERNHADGSWAATVLTEGEILRMPEIGIEIHVEKIYLDVTFSD